MFVRNGEKNNGRKAEFCGEVMSRERAAFLIEKINQCNYLVRMAKGVGGHLARSSVVSWRRGDEDLVKWNERKGDQMYEITDFYEKETR